MGRSRGETPIRGAASERAERTDIRSGELPGVTVRQATSPNAAVEGGPDPRRRRTRPAHSPRSVVALRDAGDATGARWASECDLTALGTAAATVRARTTPTTSTGLRPAS